MYGIFYKQTSMESRVCFLEIVQSQGNFPFRIAIIHFSLENRCFLIFFFVDMVELNMYGKEHEPTHFSWQQYLNTLGRCIPNLLKKTRQLKKKRKKDKDKLFNRDAYGDRRIEWDCSIVLLVYVTCITCNRIYSLTMEIIHNKII